MPNLFTLIPRLARQVRTLAIGLVLLTAFYAALLPVARAQDVQPIPALTAHVIDQTDTLNAAQRQALESKLTVFEQKRGAQIVVLIVATTLPEDIAAFAQRVGDHWKIGRKNIGDGLLLVAFNIDVIVPAIERALHMSFLPSSIYLISRMPSDPQRADIVPVVALSLLLAFVATLYPSWRASRVQPAEALRYE